MGCVSGAPTLGFGRLSRRAASSTAGIADVASRWARIDGGLLVLALAVRFTAPILTERFGLTLVAGPADGLSVRL